MIQRVGRASVEVDDEIVGSIGRGLMVLLGIEQGDTMEQVQQLATKLLKLRLWPDLKDPNKQWASSVVDNGYQLLVVSQFTLFATFKKPKPDFHQAMGGDEAKALYEAFVEKCRAEAGPAQVATGVFGAMMQVDLRNEGPVTVELTAAPAGAVPTAQDGQAGGSKPRTSAGDAAGGDLEALLEHQPYISGYMPSSADAELFCKLRASGAAGPPATPNMVRWFEHVASFSDYERSAWS